MLGSSCGLIIKSQAENRAWKQALRLQSSALVESRLAKVIGLDEYAADRKRFQDDASECSRRAGVGLPPASFTVVTSRVAKAELT
jgi:hypothetical protein